MGDYAQVLVCLRLELVEAHGKAAKIRDLMLTTGVIDGLARGNVLSESMGHRPGPRADQICDEPLKRRAVNGVEFLVGRNVYPSGEGGIEATCPLCHARHGDDWWSMFPEWKRSGDAALLKCDSCNVSTSISKWHLSPPLICESLAIRFWNWPKLKSSFVKELERTTGVAMLQFTERY